MKVILLQDIPDIGKKWDLKNVSDGYARNFLLPKKLAELAVPQAVKKIEAAKKYEEERRLKDSQVLKDSFKKLQGLNLAIKEKASEKGQLFAGIDSEKIANELSRIGIEGIRPDFIELKKPIKKLGKHIVGVKSGDIMGELTIEVVQ